MNKQTQPPSPEETTVSPLDRLFNWVDDHRPLAMGFMASTGLLIYFFVVPVALRSLIWDGLWTHQLIVTMLVVFTLLVLSLLWAAGQRFDAWIFMLFNVRGWHPEWLDHIMSAYTQLGSATAALALALAAYASGEHLLCYELLLGTLTLWMWVEMTKFIVHRARPFIHLTQIRIVGMRAHGRSFPSGHTSQVFFLATLLTQHYHLYAWAAFLLYGAALLVGITRMYVGAHYPRDVLAGAILGTVWGLLGVIVDAYIFNG